MAPHRLAPAPLLGPLAFALALTAPAFAGDVAAAEALFNRGVADMKANKFETGCPAIEESYRLDPRPGTLFTLAQCEAKRGRVATAVTRYGDYLALFSRLPPDQQTQQKGRDKIATEKKAELLPEVPEITLTLPPDAPRGTVIKRDDAVLSEAALGVALPIDPGDHVVTTQAPGGDVTETKITLQRREKKQIVLKVKTAAAAPSTASATPSASAAPTSAPPPPDTGSSSGQRTAAFVVGGVGVAALAVGGVMGGLALGKKAVVKNNCSGVFCNHEGKVAADAGKRFALVSTIGFGVGLAGVATAIVLFATAPKAPKGTAKVDKAAPKERVMGDVWSTDQGGTVLGVRGAW